MTRSGDRGQESGVRGDGAGDDGYPPALPPGFLTVDSPREFRDPTALVVRVPPGIRSKQKLFAIFADKLRFPRYFGWNWDALEELLRDLSWLPSNKAVIIVHEDLPFGTGGENREVYFDVLKEAVAFWEKTQRERLRVICPAEHRDDA